MTEPKFREACIRFVKAYVNKHLDLSDRYEIDEDQIYVVWMCKTLQNNKALLSTDLKDGMYYEITYNGDKKEFYFDAYKKFENICFTEVE